VFCFSHYPSFLRPAFPGAGAAFREPPGGLTGLRKLGLRLGQFSLDLSQEAAVFGQPQDGVDTLGFAPGHQ
jgi:hypothetical protein